MIKLKLYFLSLSLLMSQNYSFSNFSIEDGLSQVSIYSIFQDDDGFVWIGTEDGLNQFDAYTFKHYYKDPFDSTTINDNSIRKIIKYNDGKILLGTQKGLSIFDKDINQFIQNPFNNYSEENTISEIFKRVNGDLWISSYENTLVVNKINSDTVHYYKHYEKGFDFLYINDIVEDSQQNIWLGTEKGLYKYLSKKDSFVNISIYNKYYINDLYIDSTNLFIATYNFFVQIYDMGSELDKTAQVFDKLNIKEISNLTITKIEKENKNKFWFGSEYDGLFVFDLKENEFLQLKHNNFEKNSLTNDYIYELYLDNKKNIWIGTGKGISLFDDLNMPFIHYSNTKRVPNFFKNNSTWEMIEDSFDHIWITSDGGLDVFKYENYTLKPTSIKGLEIPNFNTVNVFEDSKKNIWIISYDKGLYLFDYVKKKTINLVEYNPEFKSAFLIDIEEDLDGNFWISSNGHGLYHYDLKSKKILNHYTEKDTTNHILSNYILVSELTDDKKTLWTGHFEGLSELNIKTGEQKTYKYNKNDSTGLSYSIVYSILQDTRNRIWVGTSFGLNLMDRENGTFRKFYKRDGLENEAIYAIEEDDFGNIWISTNKGLSRINPANYHFTNFTMTDGLQSKEFNAGSSLKLKDGRLIFGGINGINYFNPEEFYKRKKNSHVSLVNFYVYNHEKKINKHISRIKRIELPFEQNVFKIEFSSFEYSGVSDIKYKYMLKGFDSEWREIKNSNFASYMNVDPGEYDFYVKIQYENNNWSDEIKLLDISIESPFWMTIWFKILLVLFVFLLIYLAYRYRYRIMLVRKEVLEKTVRKRTEELVNTVEELRSAQNQLIQAEKLSSLGQMLAGIAHEMNTPLAYIMNNIFLSKRIISNFKKDMTDEEFGKINERLIKLLSQSIDGTVILRDLISELKTFSRTDSDVKVKASLNEIIDKSLQLIRSHTKDSEIIIETQIEPDIDLICHPNQIGQIFVNLINNACHAMESYRKTSQDEKISVMKITVYTEDKKIYIIVTDNGGGISDEVKDKIFDPFFTTKDVGEGTGLGLSITYNIVKQHEGDIFVESVKDQGTTFKIIFNRT
jgi:signal transduction histidine kinase/ligand-binding sensor domain-containing protein